MNDLYITGEYEKIVEILSEDEFDKFKEENEFNRSLYYSFYIRTLLRLGKLNEAENQFKDKLKLFPFEVTSLNDLIDVTTVFNVFLTKGKSKSIIEFESKNQELTEILRSIYPELTPEYEFWLAFYYYLIGIAYYYNLKHEIAKMFLYRSIKLNKVNDFIKGKSYYYLAFIEQDRNNEIEFEQHLDRSYNLYKKINANQGIGWISIWKSQIQIVKGNYPEANNYLHEASNIFQSMGGNQELNLIQSIKGLLLFLDGDTIKARDLLNESFSSPLILQNPMIAAYCFLPFVIINIEHKSRDLIRKNLDRFKKINKSRRVEIQLELAEALYLKSSTRLLEKAKAQEILFKLLRQTKMEDNFFIAGDKSLPFFLTINLADLFYQEYMISKDLTILQDFQNLLLEFDEHVSIIPIEKIEISYLRSKVFLLSREIDMTFKELSKAMSIAEQFNYDKWIRKIDDTKTKIATELHKDASMSDRLLVVEMDDYIKEALKIIR